MTNNRRSKSVRSKKRFQRRSIRLLAEVLEAKLPLDASGIANGNDCAPDLDLAAVAIQTAEIDQQITIDLQAQGGFATDVDASGAATNDSIIWQLDPDDNPANATITSDGVFTWTPTAAGDFEFIVLAIDDGDPALADAEIFTINVPAGNTAPDLAEVADRTAVVGQELVVDFTATDIDGDALIFQIDPDELAAIGGTLEQTAEGGQFRFTPGDSFAGQTIELTAIVVDAGSPPRSDSERFSITVSGIVAAADTYTFDSALTTLNVSAEDGVLANDGDSSLTASLLEQPANGNVVLEADGSFTYTPNTDFRGTDTFTYQAEDADGDIAVGTVSVIVNSGPAAVDDAFTVEEDATLVVEASSGLLVNDSDPEGDVLTARILTAPDIGELALEDDGAFTYTPAANFNGDVTFTYIVDDGALTSQEATATITVTATNDVPVGTADTYETTEETELGVSIADGILANDIDVDGDALTVTLVESATNGSLSLSADGSFIYTPVADFNGADSFTYTVTDGELTSAETTVTINVGAVNDAPVALLDVYNVNEGGELVVDVDNGVLANDTDVDGDSLTAILDAQPFNGSVVFNANGSFSYMPDDGFTGTDNFTYLANDGTVDSNVSLVSIEVADVNQIPVGVTDTYDATEDTILTVSAETGVLSNDSDADGDTLTVSIANMPTEGMLSLGADGAFEYQPSQDSTGTDTFTYRINDGTDQSEEIVVQINVTIVNDSPVATTDSYSVAFDQVLTVDAGSGVLANDTDVDDTDLSASVVTDVQNGTLVLAADGSFTYTPTTGFTGSDTFTYQVNDGEATSDAIVSIQVTGANTFAVSEAAGVDDVVGTVNTSALASQPVFFQFADDSFASELLLNEDDHISGATDAPVVLVEYLDFACSACAAFHPIVQQLEQDFDGDLLVVRRHLPLETIHPNARAAARVAEAAGQQGQFEGMADLLFENQADWAGLADPSAVFTGYAQELRLNIAQYTTDVVNAELNLGITEDADDADTLQVSSTPTFFLNERVITPGTGTEFSTLIQAEIDSLQDTYKIDRLTGEIAVLRPSEITDETVDVLVTDDDGNTETIAVIIDAIAGTSGGVLSSGFVDDAIQGDVDWL